MLVCAVSYFQRYLGKTTNLYRLFSCVLTRVKTNTDVILIYLIILQLDIIVNVVRYTFLRAVFHVSDT